MQQLSKMTTRNMRVYAIYNHYRRIIIIMMASLIICCCLVSTGFSAIQPAMISADTTVHQFNPKNAQWSPTVYAKVGLGSEFTYDGHLYRMTDSGYEYDNVGNLIHATLPGSTEPAGSHLSRFRLTSYQAAKLPYINSLLNQFLSV